MSVLIEYGLSRRFVAIALSLLAIIYIVRLTPHESITNHVFGTSAKAPEAEVGSSSTNSGFRIGDKVALISDTEYSASLVPLILHFHVVLGPEWPIVFYTSAETRDKLNEVNGTASAIWQRTVAAGAIDVRIIPDEWNMTTRQGVNVYLSRPWLWEQMAPAKHVLVFQTDAMICANSKRTMEDFLHFDFIGAPMNTRAKLFNGGLSLRNRNMMMEILANPANNWEAETAAGTWTLGGEDIWFSRKIELLGGNLPTFAESLTFSCQHDWHISREKQPLGYHKVHKVAAKQLPEIAEWCPEIALAAPGKLAQHA